jgi:flavorubredoxin
LGEDKILFTCDLFGSHLATTDLYVTDEGQVYEAAKRYYAEIMMPFRTSIQRDIVKLNNYAIDIIATSHGPIYDKPKFILDAYRDWISDEPKNIVVIPYTSMYGATGKMVKYLTEALRDRNIAVKEFELAVTDIGKLAMALVDAATVVVGTPTVLAGAHPLAVVPVAPARRVDRDQWLILTAPVTVPLRPAGLGPILSGR